jgi:hypothetical protein
MRLLVQESPGVEYDARKLTRPRDLKRRSSQLDPQVAGSCVGSLFRFVCLLYRACDQLGLGAIEAWADTSASVSVAGASTVKAVKVVKENEREEE